ncbi:hypothetical protein PLIIFM63780_004873 [Purpureocillium lilacinum]|uniref:UPF0016 domain protein n=1 Tax=Purpureocillium lilacinum TaxID=33203 RepID=A0A179H7W6_PURLI|nr:hypothetical protein Purlil1_10478 [Purpureocillium lilacinum]OAQ86316.1 hypothetical protein VFPBJ_00356 [Purpureocillium lilacinum]PWI71166.1 UPF0016 domain protein [Purpureocillium lilacinum]GJN67433.1 hypothetical protein PLICBS_001458 [Purpureocillium lilacinum]GJN81340.1 hypothetical protein PLIIFM63780_004873 [Purpureocillium lilacinum]
MRFRTKHSPLLLLLLPSLAAGLAAKSGGTTAEREDASVASLLDSDDGAKSRSRLSTKDAPFDGKDGKPHLGPFVETDGTATDSDNNGLPPLKGRPHDPTVVDGKKIPESNDGVMFDKNRERPQGSTGTEGGVTEKSAARKAQEGKTGEKTFAQPEAPKEKPPMPHSEEQKLGKDGTKEKGKDKTKAKSSSDKVEGSTDYTGLDKPEDLPGKHRDKTPLPDSVKESPLEPEKVAPISTGKTKTTPQDEEGIIQPFHSFVLSFTMILVSEVGDKTFLVAALMAMKHDRMVVFSAAFGALLVMTVLSAVLGHAVPTLIPKRLTSFLAAGLFLIFGAKLLREGMKMDPNEGVSAEMHEVEQELAEKEKELGRSRHDMSPHALEMGLNGRSSRAKSRFPSPPRSPSQSPTRSPTRSGGSIQNIVHGVSNLCSLLLSPAWVQTFAMTFLGEWGDRSQIATIAMAAGQDYWWVTLGATCGHAICTGVAVLGGRAIAGRVSLKVVTVGGAIAFLLFAFIYFIEALHG